MPDTFTPNLNLDKPALSAFDIWGFKHNSNMDIIDAASAMLRGTPVVATAPTLNQVLKFNGTSWAPAAESGATVDASATVKGITKLSVAPASPTNPIACGDNDTRLSDARTPAGTASGDLSGSYPGPTVAKINGVSIGSPPTTGQALIATSPTSATWQSIGTGTVGGSGTAGQLAFWTSGSAIGGDSNITWDNTNKSLILGPAPLIVSDVKLQVSASGAAAPIVAVNYGTGFAPVFVGAHAGGTFASPTATPSGDELLAFEAIGHDGTIFDVANSGGSLQFQTSELWSASAHGTIWKLNLCPVGSIAQSAILFATATGGAKLGIGMSSPAYAVDAVGDANVSSMYRVGGAQIASSNLLDSADLIKTSTPLGGDLFGSLPNAIVAKLNGVAVPLPPSAGQYLTADSATLASWKNPVVGGDLIGSLPNPIVAKVNGVTVSLTPSAGKYLTADSAISASWKNPAVGGDLLGSLPNPTVEKVNGVSIGGTPASGYIIVANSASSALWQAQPAASALKTTGSDVVVSAASPPTTGQVLTATSATAANWQTPSGGGITGSGVSGQITFWTGGSTVGGDTGFLWDNTNKSLVLGPTPLVLSLVKLQVSADAAPAPIVGINYGAGFNPSFIGAHAGGTFASPTATPSGDAIVEFIAIGHDGTSFDTANSGGVMKFESSQLWTASAHGTAWKLNLCPNGSVTSDAVLFATRTGGARLGIGMSTPGYAADVFGDANVSGVYRVGGTQIALANLSDGSDATRKSTLTTKGDLYVATAASTPARLGVGTNGQVLTADSAQTTGAKWATPTPGGYATVVVAAPTGVAATDTANIQAAIDSIGTGTVILRDGFYVVNAAIVLKAGITLRGNGKGEYGAGAPTTLKCADAFPDAALFDNSFRDISLEDFAIDFNGFTRAARSGSYDIRLLGVRSRMSRISLANTSGVNGPITITCSTTTDFDTPQVSECFFVQGKLSGSAPFNLQGKVTNCTFVGNTATGGFQDGLVRFGQFSEVTGCVFRTDKDYTTGASGATVHLTTVTNNSRSGMSLTNCAFIQESGTATRALQIFGGGIGAVAVVGNYAGGWAASGTAAGSISVITPSAADKITITGNAGFASYSGGVQSGNDGQHGIVNASGLVSVTGTPASGSIISATGASTASWGALSARIIALDSNASAGGSATETLTVTGLLTTDTILAVTQRVAGTLSTSVIAFANQATNALDISWTLNPGSGAIVRVAVLR